MRAHHTSGQTWRHAHFRAAYTWVKDQTPASRRLLRVSGRGQNVLFFFTFHPFCSMFLTRNRKWRRILLSHNLHLSSSPGRAPLARPPSPTRAQRSPRLPPWSAPPAKRTCSGLPCCLCPMPVRAHTFSEDEPTEEGSGQPARVRGQTNTLSAGWFPALFATNMAVWRDGYFRVRRRISLLLLRGRPPPAGGKVKRSTN